jgi:hypothetical protein
VAVVAIVATAGAALAVIAPAAAATIAASTTVAAIGTVVSGVGAAYLVANTVQSLRHRDLLNNPISSDEAAYNLGFGLGGFFAGPLSKPISKGVGGFFSKIKAPVKSTPKVTSTMGSETLDDFATMGGKTASGVAEEVQSTTLVTQYPSIAEITGTTERTFLMPGAIFDRYGGLGGGYGTSGGRWGSIPGTPYGARSIPEGLSPYTQFEVLKPFEVPTSLASPGMLSGQTGRGVQFQFPVSIQTLLKRNIVRKK